MSFLISVLRWFKSLIPGSDEDAEDYLRSVERDLFDESRSTEQERQTHNENIRPAYWWAGSKTWIDYDGKERKF